jgi:hypothetical protein
MPHNFNQKGIVHVIILAIILIVLVIFTGYYITHKEAFNNVKNPLNQVNVLPKTPYDELEAGLNKTIAAKTAYIDFKTKVNSHVTAKTGLTKTSPANLDGYLTGSTNGDINKAQLRISSPESPNNSVNIDVITVKGGDTYIKGPATGIKWQKITKVEAEAQNNKNPTDASLYSLEVLSTLFSQNKALFKTIKKESVQKMADQIIDGKKYDKYDVEISVVDFVNVLSSDPDKTEKDKKDAKIILKDTTLAATYFIDKQSGFVTKVYVSGKNLSNVPTPQTQQLGISATYDFDLNADLSRFDVPTGVTIPDSSELMAVDSQT